MIILTSQVILLHAPSPQEDQAGNVCNPLIDYCKLSLPRGGLFQLKLLGTKQAIDIKKIYSN